MFPCLGSFGFPAFLFPAFPDVALDGAVLPTAGDFLVVGGLNHRKEYFILQECSKQEVGKTKLESTLSAYLFYKSGTNKTAI